MTDLKETLPKSGHVTEVCKEWLVREDGALAYRLQSQEINEFYNGNKFRNAVVRQDFPTALHEQIKEKEDALKQAELYQRRLIEQEHADAELAKQITDKLERERERERLRECTENESMARLLQRVYIEKESQVKNKDYPTANVSHRNQLHHLQENNIENAFVESDVDFHEPKSLIRSPPHIPMQSQAYENVNNAYKPLPPVPPPAKYALPPKRIPPIPSNNNPPLFPFNAQQSNIDNSSHHSDITESIRQYNLNDNNVHSEERNVEQFRPSVEQFEGHSKSYKLQLSPEKYDFIMQNLQLSSPDEIIRPQEFRTVDDHRQNHIANGMRSNKPAIANIKNVSAYKKLGIPPEEFLDLDRKLEQEKRDEELAVRLQKEEARESLTQEEKDRLLAIEAQDKELAKMLQERERAKAKRAKEKARLKKIQTRPQSDFEPHSQLHRSPEDLQSPGTVDIMPDGDSYSNPIDLLGSGRSSTLDSYHHEKMRNSADHAMMSIRDDEIYTLPIEDDIKAANRPNSIALHDDMHKQYVRGNHSPESIGNIATVIDPTYTNPNSQQNTLNLSPLGYSSTTAPPYMPIQGTRRSASLEGKKKRTKDKCSHQ